MEQFLEDLGKLKEFLGREITDDEITPIEEPKAAPSLEEDGGTLSLF